MILLFFIKIILKTKTHCQSYKFFFCWERKNITIILKYNANKTIFLRNHILICSICQTHDEWHRMFCIFDTVLSLFIYKYVNT